MDDARLPAEVEPRLYTLAPLRQAIAAQLRLLPASAQEISITVTFDPDSLRTIDRNLLPTTVEGIPVDYPERPAETGCLWHSAVECWDGERGDDWTSCYWFSWTGNNL